MISPGAVDTELPKSFNDPQMVEMLKETASIEGFGLRPEDIADAVAYAINTPESVAINEILIRPTKQSM